jgi:Family of unknown function (DUF6223)
MSRWALRKGIDKFEREWSYDASDVRDVRDVIDASPRAAWLFSRVTGLIAAALVVGLAAPSAAHVSVQPPAVSVYTMTPERIAASVAVVMGLIGAVIGGLALARSAGRIGTGNRRRGAIVALVLGPIGLVIGGLVVATADGGLGTGNGLGGGVVAMMVGLIGMALGGLALARARRTS